MKIQFIILFVFVICAKSHGQMLHYGFPKEIDTSYEGCVINMLPFSMRGELFESTYNGELSDFIIENSDYDFKIEIVFYSIDTVYNERFRVNAERSLSEYLYDKQAENFEFISPDYTPFISEISNYNFYGMNTRIVLKWEKGDSIESKN